MIQNQVHRNKIIEAQQKSELDALKLQGMCENISYETDFISVSNTVWNSWESAWKNLYNINSLSPQTSITGVLEESKEGP